VHWLPILVAGLLAEGVISGGHSRIGFRRDRALLFIVPRACWLVSPCVSGSGARWKLVRTHGILGTRCHATTRSSTNVIPASTRLAQKNGAFPADPHINREGSRPPLWNLSDQPRYSAAGMAARSSITSQCGQLPSCPRPTLTAVAWAGNESRDHVAEDKHSLLANSDRDIIVQPDGFREQKRSG
jgi:hypothetical protein